jgi:ubiquinone/menaquinone biosynthesis C-methylase UbiE
MALDYNKTLAFWEGRGRCTGLDNLNVTMLRDKLPELARFIDRVERAHLRRIVTTHRGMTALDLGCGSGRIALYLAQRCRKVVAVDFSQALVERGRRRAEQRGLANIQWVCAPVGDFRSDERFDLIFLGSLLQYIDDGDLLPLLNRAREMLAPDGALVSRDSVLSERESEPPQTPPDYEVTYRRAQDYVRMFQEAGLEIVYINDLYAFPVLAYAYDRLLPRGVKSATVARLALAAGLRVQQLIDPLLLRMPKLNDLLAGRRAKIIQKITLCRRRP